MERDDYVTGWSLADSTVEGSGESDMFGEEGSDRRYFFYALFFIIAVAVVWYAMPMVTKYVKDHMTPAATSFRGR